jgi:hypothetical protein
MHPSPHLRPRHRATAHAENKRHFSPAVTSFFTWKCLFLNGFRAFYINYRGEGVPLKISTSPGAPLFHPSPAFSAACALFCIPWTRKFNVTVVFSINSALLAQNTGGYPHQRHQLAHAEVTESMLGLWIGPSPGGTTEGSPGRKPWENARQDRKPRRGDTVFSVKEHQRAPYRLGAL